MRPRRRDRRSVRHAAVAALALTTAVVAAVTAGVVLLTGSPAYAHANLVSSSPAHGTRLDEAPEEIRLRFSERITVAGDGIELSHASGDPVPTEPAAVDPQAPTEARLPVPADLPEGTYLASFRAVSADSHPVSGAIVFSFGDGPVEAVDIEASTDDTTVSAVFTVFRWGGYAGLALFAGTLLIFVACWPDGWANPRARRVVAIGWSTSIVSAIGGLLLQGPYAAGRSVVAVTDPTLLAVTLETDYGRYVLARLGLLVAGGLLVLRRPAPRRRGPRAAATVVLGVALPATWLGTGHTNTAGSPLDLVVGIAHLIAMSAWFGGLALLAVCLLPRAAALPVTEVAPAVRRFSLVATAAVATLVGTGLVVAWREVGSPGALPGTQYGRLLVFKLTAIGLLLWLGAMSRSVVQRRYVRSPPELAASPDAGNSSRSRRRAVRSAGDQELRARSQLRQSVRLEVGTAVAVLAVASVLVATPPGVVVTAAPAAPVATEPVEQEVPIDGGGRVQVLVDPAWSGDNYLGVTLWDRAGASWQVPEVTASFALPDRDLGPLPVELTEVQPGAYEGAAQLPAGGQWRLRLVVRTSEIDSTTVLLDIPVT